MATTEEIKLKFTIDGKEVEVTLNNYDELLKQVVSDFKKGSNDTVSSFAKIGNAITGINQGLELVRKAYEFISKPIELAGQFEQYEASLKVMLGSTDAAKERLEELVQFAKETPFELPGVVEAANQLQAMGKYSQDNLRMLGDLASASGKPMEQALSAYAKLVSGQKGIAVDMFRDLLITTDDWIEATGKGVTKNGELLASTSELIGAIPEIMKKKNFTGMMEEQAKTINGQISNMADAFGQLQTSIGQALLPATSAVVNLGIQFATSANSIVKGTAALDKFNEQAAKVKTLENNIDPLIRRIEELQSKTNLSAAEQDELKEAVKRVGDVIPGAVTRWNEYGEAIGISTDKAREQLEIQRQMLIAMNADAIEDQQSEWEDALKERAVLIEQLQKGKWVETPELGFGTGEWIKLTDEEIVQLNKKIAEYTGIMQKAETEVNKLSGIVSPENNAINKTVNSTGTGTADSDFAKTKAKLTEEIELTRKLQAVKDNLSKADDREVAFAADDYKIEIEKLNDEILKAKDEQTLKKLEADKKYNEESLKLAEAELKDRQDLIDQDLKANRDAYLSKLKGEEALAEERKKQDAEYAKISAESIANRFDRERALLDVQMNAELKSVEGYENADILKTKIHEKYQRERAKIDEEEAQAQIEVYTSALNYIAGAVSQNTVLGQAAAIANATMSTYEAATKALTAGPIVGPILAGVITAVGLANVAKIADVQMPGFAKGGVIVGENGPEVITPARDFSDMMGMVTDNIFRDMETRQMLNYYGGNNSDVVNEIKNLNTRLDQYLANPVAPNLYIGDRQSAQIVNKGGARNRRSRG